MTLTRRLFLAVAAAATAGTAIPALAAKPLTSGFSQAGVKAVSAGQPASRRIVVDEGVFPSDVAAKEFSSRKS